MDKRDIREILDRALVDGGAFAEVYVEDQVATQILSDNGKIERAMVAEDKGIGIRVISGDTVSYGYTNDLRKEKLLSIAKKVGSAAKSTHKECLQDFTTKAEPIWQKTIQPPNAVDLDVKIQEVRAAQKAAEEFDQRIKQVTVNYHDVIQNVTIANSQGTFVQESRVRTRMSANAIVRDNEGVQTGYASVGAVGGHELFAQNAPEEIGALSAKRAVALLSAKPCPGGKMDVVLSCEAGGTMVHEACGHGLEGDLVQKGMSAYGGKLGQKVADARVSVIDDATIANRYGSYAYDDEGAVGRKNVLIRDGILEQYMYDAHTAQKEGKTSTGNGRRESYRHKPITRMSNTYIASGQDDPEEMIASVKQGILVTRMGGGQVNTINGDYVFDVAEGYMLSDGEIAYPLKGATLAGNGPQSLQNIEMIGKDMGFGIGTCGKNGQGVPVGDAQPSLKISGLVVGGTQSKASEEMKRDSAVSLIPEYHITRR